MSALSRSVGFAAAIAAPHRECWLLHFDEPNGGEERIRLGWYEAGRKIRIGGIMRRKLLAAEL
jgi:hypothetical protein